MAKQKSKPVASKKTSVAVKPAAKGTGGKNRLPAEKAPKKKASKIDWEKLEREASARLDEAYDELMDALGNEADAKEEHKNATKMAELKQIALNGIVRELKQIRSGEYQPTLFDAKPGMNGQHETNGHVATAPTAVDEGAKLPLSALLECKAKDGKPFLTASKVDKIKEIVGATIGDLEKFQKENSFDWAKKIKGLGDKGLDNLQDAHLAFRSKHPIPNVVLTASEKAAKGAESTAERAKRLGCESALANKPRENPFPDVGPEQTEWFAGYDTTKAGPQVTMSAAPAAPGKGKRKADPKQAELQLTDEQGPIPEGPEGATRRNKARAAKGKPGDGDAEFGEGVAPPK